MKILKTMYKDMRNLCRRSMTAVGTAAALGGCATLSNEAMIPVSFTTPQCQMEIQCTATNKRGSWSFTPPQTVMIRRSDDTLHVQCSLPGGKQITSAVASDMEHGKMAASIFLLDLGITDAITDKHRTYPSQVIIPGRC